MMREENDDVPDGQVCSSRFLYLFTPKMIPFWVHFSTSCSVSSRLVES